MQQFQYFSKLLLDYFELQMNVKRNVVMGTGSDPVHGDGMKLASEAGARRKTRLYHMEFSVHPTAKGWLPRQFKAIADLVLRFRRCHRKRRNRLASERLRGFLRSVPALGFLLVGFFRALWGQDTGQAYIQYLIRRPLVSALPQCENLALPRPWKVKGKRRIYEGTRKQADKRQGVKRCFERRLDLHSSF